ncbi:glycosyltransferase family 2 protein [Parafrankia discariae]|uniref:glycosyltransferase family 2 protein n=1 Tax=Parafrankia discariae TaxID=365528 RepID=UPI000361593C|nr:glycosyltransferase [Parafrankia discariae]
MSGPPRTAVIVCCHLVERWDLLIRALDSLAAQEHRADQIVVVVDGDDELHDRIIARGGPETVLATGYRSGLSHARNVGLAAVDAEFVAFLDDDAVADPSWLARLRAALLADPDVLGAGGVARPDWAPPAAGSAPRWFPPELLWTVGCTHPTHPTGRIRNLFGGCALYHRRVFDTVGGFDDRLGRRHRGGAGCEETELCMRARAALPGGYFVLVPGALIRHRVHADRQRPRYLLRRCWDEGRSKATLRSIVPPMPRSATTGLAPELAFLTHAVPRGVAGGVSATLRGDGHGLVRAGMLIGGSLTTVVSFAAATARDALSSLAPSPGRPSSRPRPLPVRRPVAAEVGQDAH